MRLISEYFAGIAEFLEFIADPGTGKILVAKLGEWLGLTTEELEARCRRSGRLSWNA